MPFMTWRSWYIPICLAGRKKACNMSQPLIYHFALLLLIPSWYKINRKCHAKHYSSIQSLQLMLKMIYSIANPLFLKSKFNQKQRCETCIACVFPFHVVVFGTYPQNESMRCNLGITPQYYTVAIATLKIWWKVCDHENII